MSLSQIENKEPRDESWLVLQSHVPVPGPSALKEQEGREVMQQQKVAETVGLAKHIGKLN